MRAPQPKRGDALVASTRERGEHYIERRTRMEMKAADLRVRVCACLRVEREENKHVVCV